MKTPYDDTYTQDNYKASFAQSYKQAMRKKWIDKKALRNVKRGVE